MGAVLQNVLVGAIVAGCAIFSAWRLLSPRLRLRSLDLLEPVLGRVAAGPLARLRARTLARLGGGCGACAQNIRTATHRPRT